MCLPMEEGVWVLGYCAFVVGGDKVGHCVDDEGARVDFSEFFGGW